MIRNVVVGRVRAGVRREQVEQALAAIVALHPPGCLDMRVGVDAGLRPGNWSFSITADFEDADAYRAYDAEAEHNRVRRELFGPISEEIVRIQFDT
ncbi:Dabb family protein [Blastococcus capsensis]|uniref:Dabb family protein n=1 Tax=Blastococcus capsensis TaxID=1564163 RepID=UPI002541C6F0|nr:Dabb family protein [Blastococcus capsensis]MDK3256898.1 Dabb family protein [Blastococcus capsensis]